MDWQLLHLLFLIIVANGTPIVLRYLMRGTFSYPIDSGRLFVDNKRLFGKTKTWRGLIGSLLFTGLFAWLLGFDLETGFLIAAGAMGGDMLSSFIKRRLGIPSSAQAPLLDQIPESLVPLVLVSQTFQLSADTLLVLVSIFFTLDIVLSQLLYKLGIRRKPY